MNIFNKITKDLYFMTDTAEYVNSPEEYRYSSAVDYAGRKGLLKIELIQWFVALQMLILNAAALQMRQDGGTSCKLAPAGEILVQKSSKKRKMKFLMTDNEAKEKNQKKLYLCKTDLKQYKNKK